MGFERACVRLSSASYAHTDKARRQHLSPGNGIKNQDKHAYHLVLALELHSFSDLSHLMKNFPGKFCKDAAKGAPR